MTEPGRMSALEAAHGVRTGQWSATDLAHAALAAAEALNPVLGAFASLAPERILDEAAAVDAAVRRGENPGPLAGVPCPIKDLAEVEGLPFEAGSKAMRGVIGRTTDVVAARLTAAGTTTLGKTATPEFGLPAYTEPADALPAVTPWDISRGAGGSSGGAAAAVAAGIVSLAHASDGGGSIRIPAASCGVVGHKPSRGWVPTLPTRPPGPGLVSDGVITRTVSDTIAALGVLAPGRDARSRPRRLRIGVLTDPAISATATVHPVCRDAVDTVAGWLDALGHEVVQAPRPFPAERWASFGAVWATGAASLPLPAEAEAELVPLTRWLREEGRRVTGVEYAHALAALQMLEHEVAQAWSLVDVVLTPTLAQPPARVGALRNDADPAADFAAQVDYTPWTSVANLTGRPSISLPLVRAEVEGGMLPIGVMLTGRRDADASLLALAGELEHAHPWPLFAPSLS